MMDARKVQRLLDKHKGLLDKNKSSDNLFYCGSDENYKSDGGELH